MITLPLPKEINRCLGHGEKTREWCDRLDNCARHVTIRHDLAYTTPCYRACTTDSMAAYLPMDGEAA